jgi:hypothetical protein
MAVSERTRKIIWVEAGGRCAICYRQVLTPATATDDPSIFGAEAHIVARSPGGPRAGRSNDVTIDNHQNLILLCSEHHKQVDDQPDHFTVELLREIKQRHRERIASLGGYEREPSAQAQLVSAWPAVVLSDPADPDSVPANGAVVRNASVLPIYQVHVEFVPITLSWAVSVIIEVVPPGDWCVSGRKVYPRPEQSALPPNVWDLPERTFVVELRFDDSNGQTWRRDQRGVLTGVTTA